MLDAFNIVEAFEDDNVAATFRDLFHQEMRGEIPAGITRSTATAYNDYKDRQLS